ncbi:MAG: cell division protein ZapA [Neolewinella sp.]|jgi:cell division protein ZapA
MSGTSQDSTSIIVVIAGRPYPLRVSAPDVDGLRSLVQEINERFNDFQVQYSDRDKQDCLVMTLLTYADELRMARQMADTSLEGELANRLQAMNTLVDGMLR